MQSNKPVWTKAKLEKLTLSNVCQETDVRNFWNNKYFGTQSIKTLHLQEISQFDNIWSFYFLNNTYFNLHELSM